jgi:tRNA nucleotidyltransferase (CCA-adding enzyme)
MSDYNFLLESRLSPEQLQVVNQLGRLASAQGLNLYLVGGAVRDLTYGHQTVRDLDFVLEGNIQRLLRQIESGGGQKKRSEAQAEGSLSGLAKQMQFDSRSNAAELVFDSGVRCELAMARTETYSRPGHRPEVAAATIFEDLKRRDFSVNAMAVSLHPNSRGLLLDPTNGVADIERRELRALHSRSFLDDPSRIYRLIRLELRLDFKTEERTQQWLDRALETDVVESMLPEQQGQELRAILLEQNPARMLKMLSERKLLAALDRKLASAKISYDRFDKIRSVGRLVPGADTFLLNFHCLVEKLPPAEKSRLAKKIIGDAGLIKQALGLEREAQNLSRLLAGPKANLPSQVYRILSDRPLPLPLFLLAHYPHKKIQTSVRNFLVRSPQLRAQLPRGELQSLGVEAGPKLDKILEQLFLDQLDGKLKTHQQLTKAMRELAGIKEKPPKPPSMRGALPRHGKSEKTRPARGAGRQELRTAGSDSGQ